MGDPGPFRTVRYDSPPESALHRGKRPVLYLVTVRGPASGFYLEFLRRTRGAAARVLQAVVTGSTLYVSGQAGFQCRSAIQNWRDGNTKTLTQGKASNKIT